MFIDMFKMEHGIAGIMTYLVCFNLQLPVGAPTSHIIAYWAYNRTFHNIISISEKYDAKFSLYVDDMTFSSKKPISGKMLFEVQCELKKVGLKLERLSKINSILGRIKNARQIEPNIFDSIFRKLTNAANSG